MGRCKDNFFTDTPFEAAYEIMGEDPGYINWAEEMRKADEYFRSTEEAVPQEQDTLETGDSF